MDLRQKLERRSRDTRWVAAALGVLLGLLTLVYYLVQRGRDLPSTLVTNRVLLFVLRNVNAILILVILFVLARNLLKLWLERRSRALGARFKTKLVATYIGLSLVPVLALFFYANELLQGSIDRWFSPSLRAVLEGSATIAQEIQEEVSRRNLRDATRVARLVQGEDLGGRRGARRDRAPAGRLAPGARAPTSSRSTRRPSWCRRCSTPARGSRTCPKSAAPSCSPPPRPAAPRRCWCRPAAAAAWCWRAPAACAPPAAAAT